MATINVKGLDHVHIQVANREGAAAWYARVLGLQIAPEFVEWARDPEGPVFLSTREGASCLALFRRSTEHNRVGDHTVAFRASARDFIDFANRLDELDLVDRDGSKVVLTEIADHELSWSFYFLDPDGNRYELTCYEYEEVRDFLAHVQRR
jgi:catechol 2,3-dioxygenase-like lactoylglutathione lyase family enzyme